VLGKKVLRGDEMFQSLARKSEEIRASLLHFCTFADLTFRFSVRHGEVDPVRGSGFSKMQKCKTAKSEQFLAKCSRAAMAVSYLCIVLEKQADVPAFADSKRQHVQTPGTNTCRLQRQQKRDEVKN